MSVEKFHRITTPETMVGAGRWSINYGKCSDGKRRTPTPQKPPPAGGGEPSPPIETVASKGIGKTSPKEEPQTEEHYSESDFHDEVPGEESDEGQHGNRIEVYDYRPKDFAPEGHLLHIDFITDELEAFRLSSSHSGQRVSRTGPSGKRTPQQQQHNISFSRWRVKEIERHNHMLLHRIRNTKATLPAQSPKSAAPSKSSNALRITSAAVNRKKVQRKIASENEMLLKKVASIGMMKRSAI